MKALINSDQAFVNILQRAVTNGYILSKHNSIEETLIEAEDFIVANCAVDKEEYCQVISHGTSQHADYADGFGTTYTSDGEIIGANSYRDAKPNEKYIFATIVNVKGEVIALWENLNLTF